MSLLRLALCEVTIFFLLLVEAGIFIDNVKAKNGGFKSKTTKGVKCKGVQGSSLHIAKSKGPKEP